MAFVVQTFNTRRRISEVSIKQRKQSHTIGYSQYWRTWHQSTQVHSGEKTASRQPYCNWLYNLIVSFWTSSLHMNFTWSLLNRFLTGFR